jgi:hypothetical protein
MKNWTVYVIAGNPTMFNKIRQSEPLRRSDASARLELYQSNGWRAWMKNEQGYRIMNQVEEEYSRKENHG